MLKKKSIGIRSLLIAATIYGAYWFAGAWSNLSQHLSGPVMHPDTTGSLEPKKIILRSKYWKNDKRDYSDDYVEWVLNVPRAYIYEQGSNNGSVNDQKSYETRYGVSFAVRPGSDEESFSPISFEEWHKHNSNQILVNLVNGEGLDFVVDQKLCIIATTDIATARSLGASHAWEPDKCGNSPFQLCGVLSEIDGWRVGMSVSKDLFVDPEKICRITKNFLNKFTVSRQLMPRGYRSGSK